MTGWRAVMRSTREWAGGYWTLRAEGSREMDVSMLDGCDWQSGRASVICAAMDLVDANGGDTDRAVRMIRMLTGADQNADDREATATEGWFGGAPGSGVRMKGCPDDGRSCIVSINAETGEGRCDRHGRPT